MTGDMLHTRQPGVQHALKRAPHARAQDLLSRNLPRCLWDPKKDQCTFIIGLGFVKCQQVALHVDRSFDLEAALACQVSASLALSGRP